MRIILIGCFYIPYVPVYGSLKIPSSGVRKVKTANRTAIKQSAAIARFFRLQAIAFSLNCFDS